MTIMTIMTKMNPKRYRSNLMPDIPFSAKKEKKKENYIFIHAHFRKLLRQPL